MTPHRYLHLLAAAQALPAPVAEPATVNREGVAVDVPALLRVCEECYRPRDILRRCEAAHRGAPLYILVGVAAAGLVLDIHLGLFLLKIGSQKCNPPRRPA